MNDTKNTGRGFAGMDEEEQKKIASEGGKAAHAKGTAHEFDSEEAKKAGQHSHDND
ncbi:MAG TPA: KGG domain-containing protein [Candidatus Saccharimonadales bacterium]|nr:KGG domain-containing protein [Candidatus Saccharimonadales bacterium]